MKIFLYDSVLFGFFFLGQKLVLLSSIGATSWESWPLYLGIFLSHAIWGAPYFIVRRFIVQCVAPFAPRRRWLAILFKVIASLFLDGSLFLILLTAWAAYPLVVYSLGWASEPKVAASGMFFESFGLSLILNCAFWGLFLGAIRDFGLYFLWRSRNP